MTRSRGLDITARRKNKSLWQHTHANTQMSLIFSAGNWVAMLFTMNWLQWILQHSLRIKLFVFFSHTYFKIEHTTTLEKPVCCICVCVDWSLCEIIKVNLHCCKAWIIIKIYYLLLFKRKSNQTSCLKCNFLPHLSNK